MYTVRDPVHGFIPFDDWEKQVIDDPTFQRLRRIRQLGLTEYVYPGTTHTRFEHSLGTMHIATQIFDQIVKKQETYLKSDRGYDDGGLARDRRIVRYAALLHDVGHSPLSHAGETLFPNDPQTGNRLSHEDYSVSIIRTKLKDAIEKHQQNDNYEITADMIADLVSGVPTSGSSASARRMIWRPLVSSQLDADRCDYLLRDSLHAGVSYGRYDLPRILDTITLGLDESDDPIISIEQGGLHAAEGLIVARYMMFTQVYFQHTRLALDHHIEQALIELLSARNTKHPIPHNPTYPSPDSINEYLRWDDWFVLGKIANGEGGAHGRYILERSPHKGVYQTEEIPNDADLEMFESIKQALGTLVQFTGDAAKSWYSRGQSDVQIVPERASGPSRGRPLSTYSRVVANMSPVSQQRIYVRPEKREQAREIVKSLGGQPL